MSDEDLGTAKGKMEIDASSLSRVGGALTQVGTAFVGVGGAMVAAFGVAVMASADFETQISSVKAVSGATEAQLEALRQKAYDLGTTTKYSAQDVATAYVSLAKAGLTAEEIIGGTAEAVVSLAAAADGLTLDQTAEIMANVLKTFNLGAEDAAHVADTLAGAANKSTLEVSDLAVTMQYAGPVASALGIGVDDLSNAIAILGDRGIRGSTAGTSLRQMMLSLSAPTKAASKEMEKLGIITEDGTNKFFTQEGQMKSLAEVSQILADATANLDPQAKAAAFSLIFQRRAMAGALILADQGTEGFNEYNEAIQGTSAADVAAIKLDNLGGDITKLKNRFKTFLIEAGGPFQETMRNFVGHLSDLLTMFENLSPEQQKFIMQLLLYGGLFLIAVGSAALFLGTLAKLISSIQIISGAMSAFSAAGGISGGLGSIAGGFGQIGGAIASLGPIGLIVIAIVALIALGVYLYNNWKPFHDLIDNFWTNFQNGLDIIRPYLADFVKENINLFNIIKDKVGGAISFINDVATSTANGIRTVWQFIDTVAQSINDFLTKTLPDAVNGIITFVTELPGKVLDTITGAVETAFNAIVEFIQKLPERAGYALGFIIGRFIRFNVDAALQAIQFGHQVIDAIVGFVQSLPERVMTFFTDLYNRISKWVVETVAAAVKFGLDFYNGVVEWFQLLPGRLLEFITTTYNNIEEWVVNTAQQAVRMGTDFYNNLVNWFQQLPEMIGGFLSDAWNRISSFATDAWNKAYEIGTNVYNGIHDGIVAIPGLVGGILNEAIEAIKGVITGAFNAASDFAGGLWDGFKDGLGINSPSYISRAMDDIVGHTNTGVQQLQAHVDTMRALSNPFSSISSDLALAVSATGAGALSPSQFKNGGSSTSTTHTEGDTFYIEKEDKSAEELSREIMTRKRFKPHG